MNCPECGRRRCKIEDIDKKIIQALADNNLSVGETAKEVFMGRSSIYRHVRKIKKETGLNPLSFWDLLNLLKSVGGDSGGECT